MATDPVKLDTPSVPEKPLVSVVPYCVSAPEYDSLAQSYGADVSRSYNNLILFSPVAASTVPFSLTVIVVTFLEEMFSLIENLPPT